jgi:hypothetical protein
MEPLALPPPVGRARASHLDEPGRGATWQRAPPILPRRRNFDMALKRARGLVDQFEEEPHVNPNTQTMEFSLRDPDGYFVTISAIQTD